MNKELSEEEYKAWLDRVEPLHKKFEYHMTKGGLPRFMKDLRERTASFIEHHFSSAPVEVKEFMIYELGNYTIIQIQLNALKDKTAEIDRLMKQ